MLCNFLLFSVCFFPPSSTCHLPSPCFSPSSLLCSYIFCPQSAPAPLRCAPYPSSVLLRSSSCSAATPSYGPAFFIGTSVTAPSSTPGFTADFQSGLSSFTASVFFSPTYRLYCIIWRPTCTSAGHSPQSTSSYYPVFSFLRRASTQLCPLSVPSSHAPCITAFPIPLRSSPTHHCCWISTPSRCTS